MQKNKGARVITPEELSKLRYQLPKSWVRVAGLLKGKKRINGLRYQKEIREEWDKRGR